MLGEVTRWTCDANQAEVGDSVFVLRRGSGARGLIAYGRVVSPFSRSDESVLMPEAHGYIEVMPEEARTDCANGMTPMLLLSQLARGTAFSWETSGSAVEIPEPLVTSVRKWWELGRGRHSLAQYITWSSQDSEDSRQDWQPRYQARLDAIETVRRGGSTLDDAMLEWLWKDGQNGVCSVKPAFLSNAEFGENKAFLRSLAERVIKDPSESTYTDVCRVWDGAVSERRFRQRFTAVINRVFAVAAPEFFTTVVSASKCRRLLKGLAADFELTVAPADDGWPALNRAIYKCVEFAQAGAGSFSKTNVALWQLVEKYLNQKSPSLSPGIANEVSVKETPMPPARDGVAYSLNQILYGPPGTGKTYSTIARTLGVLAPELLRSGATRGQLKAAFDRYVSLGQVVFTTFHQSFSYEDFVEGLRARSGEEGGIRYEVEDGLFKRLCVQARSGQLAKDDPFEQALARLVEQMEAADDERLEMQTTRGKRFLAHYDEGPTFLVYPASNPDLAHGYTGSMEAVRSLYLTGEKKGLYNASYVQGMLDYLKAHCELPEQYAPATPAERKPFVLIIDEINRGNVSRIFGELITLIETSKREGSAEALSVLLPYSKQAFSVPDNVYIIGTMNTADRSLASLDVALRRRFEFVEMLPDPALLDGVVVEGVVVSDLLRVMNQRIEVLLDREHCLGHAFFMPLKEDASLECLADIFRRKVLPLLQEYFFEDWQRIQWVLNDHRKPDSLRFVRKPATNIRELFGEIEGVSEQSQRWEINEDAFRDPASFSGIVSASGGGPA